MNSRGCVFRSKVVRVCVLYWGVPEGLKGRESGRLPAAAGSQETTAVGVLRLSVSHLSVEGGTHQIVRRHGLILGLLRGSLRAPFSLVKLFTAALSGQIQQLQASQQLRFLFNRGLSLSIFCGLFVDGLLSHHGLLGSKAGVTAIRLNRTAHNRSGVDTIRHHSRRLSDYRRLFRYDEASLQWSWWSQRASPQQMSPG